MSIPDRLLRISKAYLNQVRDRIDSELSDAERELNTGVGGASAAARANEAARREASESDAESMMRRAEERIASARSELESREELRRQSPQAGAGNTAAAPSASRTSSAASGTTSTASIVARTEDPNASDFRVLGVEVGGDLSAVTSAYEELARRCDPRRFPEGSAEQQEAARILARINVSFEALRKRLDPTSNRFGKLELE